MSATPQTQAMQPAAAGTPAVITTPDEFSTAMARWQKEHHNVLTAFSNIAGLAASHAIQWSMVQLDPDPTKGGTEDVYDGLPFLKKDQVAPAKRGLRKIAEALGISIRIEHLSVGRVRHYWLVKAIASYRGIDGSTVIREACMEWDLRDGSDRLKGWTTAAQISEGRKHGLRACETRAINAVIRECGCGVKQAYTKGELAKPFVAVRVVFLPDYSDPEVKRLVTERALSGTNQLYAPTAPSHVPSVPAFADDDEPRVKTIGSGSTPAANQSTGAPQSKPPVPATEADQPPTPDAVRIADVRTRQGETGGKKWTRYIIVDSRGAEHSTFDKGLADYAEKAKAARQWVEIAEEADGQYKNLVEITPAGQQPSLLPDQSDL